MKFELTIDIKDEDINRFIKLLSIPTLSLEHTQEHTKITLTIDEAAKLSGIGRSKLLELCHGDNNFPAFRVGSKFLINKLNFIEWLNIITEGKLTL